MTAFTLTCSPCSTSPSSFSVRKSRLPARAVSPPVNLSASSYIPSRGPCKPARCLTRPVASLRYTKKSTTPLAFRSPLFQKPLSSPNAASSRGNASIPTTSRILGKHPSILSRQPSNLRRQECSYASVCIATVSKSHYHWTRSHRQFEPTSQLARHRVGLRFRERWCQNSAKGISRRRGLVCQVVEGRPKTGEGPVASRGAQSNDKALEKSRGEQAEPSEPGGLARLREQLRDRLSIDDLWWEILVVSFPALLALAADPVASLFETSLLGNLGPAQLAAAGVSINVFNTLCKLFNFPLLNVTTSFVAEAETQRKLEREDFLRSLEDSRRERGKSEDRPLKNMLSELDEDPSGTKSTAERSRQGSDGLYSRTDERSDEGFEEGLRERRASGGGACTRDGSLDVRRNVNGREVRSEGSLWTGDGVLESSEFRIDPKSKPGRNGERVKPGAGDANANVDAPRKVFTEQVKSANLESNDGVTDSFDTADLESGNGLTKPVNTAVSASIIMGAALGLVESLVLGLGARNILGLYGTNAEMMGPASMYLALRAIGAPALVVSLAVSGAFRGFGDTKTPLYAQVASNILNVALLPLFMFTFGWGIAGAAAATVTSQYVQMTILLVCISRRCQIVPRRWQDLKFRRFLGAGGVLLGRTLASLFTMSLATSMAARTGTASMAAHQICIQVWLAASLLSDSVALAGQTILARAFAEDDVSLIDTVARRIMKLGLLMGGVMAAVFLVGRYAIPLAFTHDPAVLAIIASLLPFIVLTQPVNALAFVWDGLHYGASDFVYSAQVMVLAAIPAMAAMYFLPQHLGIAGVWVGLAVLMSARAVLGVGRYMTKSGPWEKLKER